MKIFFSSLASKPINISWIRTGSVSHTEKSCIALYYRQFSTNNKHNINSHQAGPLDPQNWLTKLDLIQYFLFNFYYPRKAVYNTMHLTIILFYWLIISFLLYSNTKSEKKDNMIFIYQGSKGIRQWTINLCNPQ